MPSALNLIYFSLLSLTSAVFPLNLLDILIVQTFRVCLWPFGTLQMGTVLHRQFQCCPSNNKFELNMHASVT